jgi:hypothetical protein
LKKLAIPAGTNQCISADALFAVQCGQACFEHDADVQTAIQRENDITRWLPAWKVGIILAGYPAWNDLVQ